MLDVCFVFVSPDRTHLPETKNTVGNFGNVNRRYVCEGEMREQRDLLCKVSNVPFCKCGCCHFVCVGSRRDEQVSTVPGCVLLNFEKA